MSTPSVPHQHASLDAANDSLDAAACDSLIFDEKQGLWFIMNRRHIKRVTRSFQVGIVVWGLTLYVTAFMFDLGQPVLTISDWVQMIAVLLLIIVLTWFVRRSISPARSRFQLRTDGLCKFPNQTQATWQWRPLSMSCQLDATTEWIRVTLHADDSAFAILHAPISESAFIAGEIQEWPWFIRERCIVPLPTRVSPAPEAQLPKEPA